MSNDYNNNYSDGNYPIHFERSNPPVPTVPMGVSQNMMMYVNQADVLAAQQMVTRLVAENRDLANTCNYLSNDNAQYHSAVNALARQNEALRRNRRKKVTSSSVMVDEKSGLICLLRNYDNEDRSLTILITNYLGPLELNVITDPKFDLSN